MRCTGTSSRRCSTNGPAGTVTTQSGWRHDTTLTKVAWLVPVIEGGLSGDTYRLSDTLGPHDRGRYPGCPGRSLICLTTCFAPWLFYGPLVCRPNRIQPDMAKSLGVPECRCSRDKGLPGTGRLGQARPGNDD